MTPTTPKQTGHTRQWRIDHGPVDDEPKRWLFIHDGNGEVLATMDYSDGIVGFNNPPLTEEQALDEERDRAQVKAEMIVRACNSHEALVEALRKIVALNDEQIHRRNPEYEPEWLKQAREAIAKAEGGQS